MPGFWKTKMPYRWRDFPGYTGWRPMFAKIYTRRLQPPKQKCYSGRKQLGTYRLRRNDTAEHDTPLWFACLCAGYDIGTATGIFNRRPVPGNGRTYSWQLYSERKIYLLKGLIETVFNQTVKIIPFMDVITVKILFDFGGFFLFAAFDLTCGWASFSNKSSLPFDGVSFSSSASKALSFSAVLSSFHHSCRRLLWLYCESYPMSPAG